MRVKLHYLVAMTLAVSDLAHGTRLKDLVEIEGVRDNQLIGYGLVVGLKGTGDTLLTVFSTQSLTNLLSRMGITVSPTAIQVKNTAAVLVTANLPAFSQPGTRIDISVSSIGDSSNLQGGVLIMTPLKGADAQVYAVGQGSVVTGGFVVGRPGNIQMVAHPTSGRIPNGAIVEQPPPSVTPGGKIHLQLRQSDFTTAARIAAAINLKYAGEEAKVAQADNAGVVTVLTPAAYKNRPVEFIADLESVAVEADRPAKIVISERTGTIVMGNDVRITPVSILHGSLTVKIETSLAVSQPAPQSQGKTEVVPEVRVKAKEEKARDIILEKGASVEELVRALVGIGSTPRDIIAILQNLRAAGAIEAELEVI
jgi:flagellar P-ring protein precursor FlgI